MQNLPRFVISISGLLLGLFVFNLSSRLPAPWDEVGAAAFYGLLAVGCWIYAKEDKFIRGVAIAIGIWALVRLVLAFT
ncbi:hypothetical protein [Deinococcus cellulosilyticus]|uniref:hypothetical protein n=1 Tax=Deinococcus cellulosilyticus TaxID=401558 RepID=UPI0011BECC52|nr:hypothetical protein [Deinococcus cellulosilyticus]